MGQLLASTRRDANFFSNSLGQRNIDWKHVLHSFNGHRAVSHVLYSSLSKSCIGATKSQANRADNRPEQTAASWAAGLLLLPAQYTHYT